MLVEVRWFGFSKLWLHHALGNPSLEKPDIHLYVWSLLGIVTVL